MHADEDAIRPLVANWLDASRAGDTDRVSSLTIAGDADMLRVGKAVTRQSKTEGNR